MLERLVEIQHQFEQLAVMGMMNTVVSTFVVITTHSRGMG